jgi:serine palmitoyltransferase
MGIDGTDQGVQRIKQLRENTIYFRDKLIKLGYIVYGCKGSPVVPALVCIPSKVV